MVTALGIYEALSELDIQREALAAIGRTGESMLSLNREQLLHGIRADRTKMPDYSYTSVYQSHHLWN